MINRPMLEALDNFIRDPTRDKTFALRGIPALYLVLLKDVEDVLATYSKGVLAICEWIACRTKKVLDTILSNGGPIPRLPLLTPFNASSDTWEQVSVLHSLEVIVLAETSRADWNLLQFARDSKATSVSPSET